MKYINLFTILFCGIFQSQSQNCFPSFGLNFDGSPEQVIVSDHSSINFGVDNFSFESWIKTTAGGIKAIVDKRAPNLNYRGYTFFIINGKPAFQMGSNSYVNYVCSSCPNVNNGQWTHLAFTVDRALNQLKFYVNGNLNATLSTAGVQGSISNNNTLRIAGHVDSGSSFYFGQIDDVRLWRKILTEVEIQNNMNTTLVGDNPMLEAYWKLDEGIGQLAYDSGPNCNSGILQNMESNDWIGSPLVSTLSISKPIKVINSLCGAGCLPSGGVFINNCDFPCPLNYTLQYRQNGGLWNEILPIYAQSGPSQSIETRCLCDFDQNISSPISNVVTSNPGICNIFMTKAGGNMFYNHSSNWENDCVPPSIISSTLSIAINHPIINPVGNNLINNGEIQVNTGGSFINEGTYSGNGTFIGNFINNGNMNPGN